MKNPWKLAFLAPPFLLPVAAQAQTQPHNVLLFVADGLRPGMVTPQTAPTMYALEHQGVRFDNTHSMFPTFTTANASAMATGHKLGDTGDFSNTIDAGFQVPGAGKSLTPFLESDPVLGDVDEHFEGDYMNQETVMRAARLAGMSTATIGKLGPALIFDHTSANAETQSVGTTIVVDDSTGTLDKTGKKIGIPLTPEMQQLMTAAGIPLTATPRGANAKAGTFNTPGTLVANGAQQTYFVDVSTKVVLPLFKQRGKPFMMVFWSRDPDGTQHNQGDSLNTLTPGIDGPTSLAAIANADHDLSALLAALKAQGLDKTTDVIITSDHGFSTISKQSKTSFAATQSYGDVVPHFLPVGFVALDIAHGLDMPLLDPDAKYAPVPAGGHPSHGDGLIGGSMDQPKVVVAANGGSDLVYLPDGDPSLAKKVVGILSHEDYVSGLFVSAKLGKIPGTLPISAIDLQGSAVTPVPSIVVNFRTWSTGCVTPLTCGVENADTGLQQGQGMHGSFSRADTSTIGGATGPDFKTGFVDKAPTSNADIGKTMAYILGLHVPDTGKLVGRVITEAFTGSKTPHWTKGWEVSTTDAEGHKTVVVTQTVGTERYFDAAGYPGRTLGLNAGK
ncbi:alkaline phosphatase family protein [Acidisoma cellulosilytica]|uniref:Alkaline phosphatase family protein n=1 Tax=Acidisoma cellulosilyticum TaxID=2802395 RepID=A0A963Z631_9PROT|nr:alkaline phosphatase family protein [Acidisoma cellulosilyticum]MCB8882740.1 alkaline phosphatase family protein [Acidisoma cellulosilyticum]